jgi:hypothetical protein
MKLKLKRIAPLQAGKMLAAFYGLLSLIMVPFMLTFMALGSFAARSHGGAGAPALPLMFGMGIGFMVMLPLLYAFLGFIFGILGAFLYNLLAKWIGGFALEFEQEAPLSTV